MPDFHVRGERSKVGPCMQCVPRSLHIIAHMIPQLYYIPSAVHSPQLGGQLREPAMFKGSTHGLHGKVKALLHRLHSST